MSDAAQAAEPAGTPVNGVQARARETTPLAEAELPIYQCLNIQLIQVLSP